MSRILSCVLENLFTANWQPPRIDLSLICRLLLVFEEVAQCRIGPQMKAAFSEKFFTRPHGLNLQGKVLRETY